jgi:hypothetical protein
LLWSCSCKHGPKRKTHGPFSTKSLIFSLNVRPLRRAARNKTGCAAVPR